MEKILLFVLMVGLCQGANLPVANPNPKPPTISLQKFDGSTFFDYVKPKEAIKEERNQESFIQADTDDAESVSTTLRATTITDILIVGLEDGNDSPPNDVPSSTGPPHQAPADSPDSGALPEAPPGDAVPGQDSESESTEGANGPSSSSSSSEDSSSSSEEYRTTWEKSWEYKLKNELNTKAGKSKDLYRNHPKLVKKENIKFSRRISAL